MSDQAPNLGDPQEEFTLSSRSELSLSELVAATELDDVHFFIREGIDDDAIEIDVTDEDARFALVPYEQEEYALNEAAFELFEEAGYEPATLRDLLNFAIERPAAQFEFDIVATGTMRTRRVFKDKPGETVWDQTDRDRKICQWAVGLSNFKEKSTLIPVELYLGKAIRKDALVLVRLG